MNQPSLTIQRPAEPTAPNLSEELEPLLAAFTNAYEALIESLKDHRAAISTADARALSEVIAREHQALERLSQLEQHRRTLVGAGPDHKTQPRLSALARTLEEPARSRAVEACENLKQLATAAQKHQRLVAQASQSLASHMEGLMRQVAQRLSHAGTYGRKGRVENGTPVVTGLDIRR